MMGGQERVEIDEAEAARGFDSLLDGAENGETILICRGGERMARLIPERPQVDRAEVQAAFDRIRARTAALPLEPFDWESMKKDRDQGRR